jgi:hypothetical protein
MLIDCDGCAVRGPACADCVVTALLDAPVRIGGLRDEECRAIEAFEHAGLAVELLEAPPPPAPLRLATRGRRRHVA